MYLPRLGSCHFSAIALLATLGIVAVLFIGGRQPIAVGLIPHPWDKVAHAGVFALLGYAIGLSSNLRGWHKLAIAFFGALLAGAFDEWHQVYLPGREAGLSDFIADIIGGIFGTAFLAMKSSRRCISQLDVSPMRSPSQGNSR
ncbi:VanZ like family protein [Nitrosospira multiformis]|uniref:VanZ like family protein n=1 Tax=Nitrosospira multiformis TaxID=1231 RepID=A0A1H8MQ10_9PROT|nr:VanZ family protein [Nitrosospira multiformis]SEO19314.1 VanZ like family protein [Nitrosospira multiformis]